jgi:hypothetical protein
VPNSHFEHVLLYCLYLQRIVIRTDRKALQAAEITTPYNDPVIIPQPGKYDMRIKDKELVQQHRRWAGYDLAKVLGFRIDDEGVNLDHLIIRV